MKITAVEPIGITKSLAEQLAVDCNLASTDLIAARSSYRSNVTASFALTVSVKTEVSIRRSSTCAVRIFSSNAGSLSPSKTLPI